MKSNKITDHHITTDDIAFSAYLKMKGHHLIMLDIKNSKTLFTFVNNVEDPEKLKTQFINSGYLQFYNELKNLKGLI